jgi:hypothetical protein
VIDRRDPRERNVTVDHGALARAEFARPPGA